MVRAGVKSMGAALGFGMTGLGLGSELRLMLGMESGLRLGMASKSM